MLFPHSLARNNLVDETDYVNKSEVQGSSFEVGAKVTYEGREMTVSQAPDIDGDITMIDLSGVEALAACLPQCKSLTWLRCTSAPKRLHLCQPPVTHLLSHLLLMFLVSQSRVQWPQRRGQTGAQRRRARGQQRPHHILAVQSILQELYGPCVLSPCVCLSVLVPTRGPSLAGDATMEHST